MYIIFLLVLVVIFFYFKINKKTEYFTCQPNQYRHSGECRPRRAIAERCSAINNMESYSANDMCETGLCLDGICGKCNPTEKIFCPSGQKCVKGLCQICSVNTDCINGYVCSENKCIECRSSKQCDSGKACVFDLCRQCINDDQCKTNEKCDYGKCIVSPS